tara:strand:- start:24230 stop:24373 length:144 start_codon:yes stop_codon:yes gene_type:complete
MKDNCVDCNVETPYDTTDSIYIRSYYIEGAGQLCKECYIKTFEYTIE